MADLPASVLTSIFQYQRLIELKYASMLVCKQWRDAANDPVLWRHATVVLSPSAASCQDLEIWITDLTKRGHTRFAFHRHCSRELIVKFCSIASSKIKYLDISGSNCLLASDIVEILSASHNVEKFLASSCSEFPSATENFFSSKQRISNFLPNLRSIDIGHTNLKQLPQYPVRFLSTLAPCPLTFLGLSGITFKSSSSEKQLIDVITPLWTLKGLDLSFTDLSNAFFMGLASPKASFSLDELNVSGCANLTVDSLQCILAKHCFLKRLVINQFRELTYLDLFCQIAPVVQDLKSLEFSNGAAIAFSREQKFKQKLDSVFKHNWLDLTELCLSNCQINDDFVTALCGSSYGKFIKVLQISSSRITDISLNMICECLVNLKSLDISRNYRITDIGFLGENQNEDTLPARAIQDTNETPDIFIQRKGLSNLRHLEDLSMMHLSKITGSSLKPVLELKRLKSLSINGCFKISSAAVTNASNHLCLLQKLHIGKLLVDDKAVEVLTKNIKFLFDFDISGCEVSDRTLDLLLQHCNCLRHLDISNCHQVTEHAVRRFINSYGRRLFELNSSVNVVYELATM